MYEIKVKTSKPYAVYVGENILKDIGNMCQTNTKAKKVLIVTDDIVDKLYSETVENSLQTSGFDVLKYVIKNGEK
ncbi:MAG: 3-dehydroquinate synthase, partial [Clostridia bacterium]